MIDISNTSWSIKTKPELFQDNRGIRFLDNGKVLFKGEQDGSYSILGEKIKIAVSELKFNGVIVEDFIFGNFYNEETKGEFECSCRNYDHTNSYMKNHQSVNVGDDNDFSIIHDLYMLIKDYRLEFSDGSRISRSKIKNWINQFDEDLRMIILEELKGIFEKRYLSKNSVKKFLSDVITKLTHDFAFESPLDFLKNSIFLNLQPNGKSQQIMLELFDEIITEKYGLSLSGCGLNSKKYSIYIDDILCTGLTLISDIKEWSDKDFIPGKTNKQAVADSSTVLIFAYVFIHNKNYHKKKSEMRFKISDEVANNHKMYRLYEIENAINDTSKIDLIYPVEQNQSQSVIDYKNEIIERVNHYTTRYNTVSVEEFYRKLAQPTNEKFFSSPQNRTIVENAFLKKGIEILKIANPNNQNMRALGYSIPSSKNFGFGALCFTWRNVPNNAPLVFWYSGGGFEPLFKVSRGINPI